MKIPDADILAWVETAVGHCQVVSHFAHDHAYSQLWRLVAGSDFIWLKMHAHERKWSGEVHALTAWADPLAPDVLAWRDNPRAVLLTEVPGVPAESIRYESAAEERLWCEAGAWLRDFHRRTNSWFGDVRCDGTPFTAIPDNAVFHVRQTMDRRLREGRERGILDRRELDFATRAFAHGLPSLEGAIPHSIHRDFTPRNWLAHPNGQLAAIIDFEHARWDVAAADLSRPWDYEFQRNPRLEHAFYEGYGQPNDHLSTQIQTMRLVQSVAGTVWGLEVNDRNFSERNRAALCRLMAMA